MDTNVESSYGMNIQMLHEKGRFHKDFITINQRFDGTCVCFILSYVNSENIEGGLSEMF